MTLEQGNIVLVSFPFSNLSSLKTRPALVVSNGYFHGQDTILCAITSQTSKRNEVSLANDDLVKGRLPVTSYVRVGKIMTIAKSLIKKIVAKISAEKMKEVAEALAKILE